MIHASLESYAGQVGVMGMMLPSWSSAFPGGLPLRHAAHATFPKQGRSTLVLMVWVVRADMESAPTGGGKED